MSKPATPVNPKRTLILKTFGKASGAFRRHMGEMGRARVNASGAARELAKVTQNLEVVLKEALGVSGLPVVTAEAPAPEGAHWLVAPLLSPRNALYGRHEVCMAVAFIDKDGTCPIGAVMLPNDDQCVVAETGLGASAEGLGRLRCANRTELADTLCMVPWKTVDVVAMNLLEILDKAEIHTRKSGNTLLDVIDVAVGRADMAMATRVTRLEALLVNLIMAESAGFASDLGGKPLGPKSETLLVANPKLHALAVRELKFAQ